METEIERLDLTHVKVTVPIRVEGLSFPLDKATWQRLQLRVDELYRQILAENDLKNWLVDQVKYLAEPSTSAAPTHIIAVIEASVQPPLLLLGLGQLIVTVGAATIADAEIDDVIDRARASHASFAMVDRPPAPGDIANIDLVVVSGGKEVNRSVGISYEVGSGSLFDGVDHALGGLLPGQSALMKSGEDELTLTLNSVQECTLPEANDDFAKQTSDSETLADLRQQVRKKLAEYLKPRQVLQAREAVLKLLADSTHVPVPDHLADVLTLRKLKKQGKDPADPLAAKTRGEYAMLLQRQMVIDAIGEQFDVAVSKEELSEYLQVAAKLAAKPYAEFMAETIAKNKLDDFVFQLARRKCLDIALSRATIKDSNGEILDLSDHLGAKSGAPGTFEALPSSRSWMAAGIVVSDSQIN